jgi:hypothetical protein
MVWCWMYRTLNQGQRLLSVHRALLVLVHCARLRTSDDISVVITRTIQELVSLQLT